MKTPSPAPVLVAGQGLAGTLLAWELEQAGRDFVIADPGHQGSASRVGAGLVNPVTGERWVATAGWAEESEIARSAYGKIERAWDVRLVSSLRIRRTWQSEAEAALVRGKVSRGELAPWIRPEGLEAGAAWIEGAWRADLPALIAAGRAHWLRQGRLRTSKVGPAEAAGWPGPVIWCTGAAETRVAELRPVGGETLELEVEASAQWRQDVVRHDGVWILPVGAGRAWAGASFLRTEEEREIRRETLRRSVRSQLSDCVWQERAVLSGWRMTSPDRRPRSFWQPGAEGREGVFNGLGSKGALQAPALAVAWVRRLAGPSAA